MSSALRAKMREGRAPLVFDGAALAPEQTRGGCEMGGGLCAKEPELEVTVPAIGAARLMCRDHVGWYMLAAAEEAVPGRAGAQVHVRRLVVLCGQIAV